MLLDSSNSELVVHQVQGNFSNAFTNAKRTIVGKILVQKSKTNKISLFLFCYKK